MLCNSASCAQITNYVGTVYQSFYSTEVEHYMSTCVYGTDVSNQLLYITYSISLLLLLFK